MGLLEDFTEEEIEEEPEEKKVEEEVEEEKLGLHFQCEETRKSVTTGSDVVYLVNLINDTDQGHTVKVNAHIIYSVPEEERIPWQVTLRGEKTKPKGDLIFEKEVEIKKGDKEILPIKVEAPEGARYGEKLEVVVDATSTKDTLISDSITLFTIARPTVIAVKTQIGQERNVADYLFAFAKKNDVGIFSILCPKPVRGYIFMEVMNPHRVEEIISGMRKAKGVVEGESSMEEIEHFLAPKLAVEGIAEGDIVELSAGPFKGEKARVTQIDEASDEITVELFEATVPIPVTVRGDHVRVLEKEG
ncbi:MAG: transcription elongation factor Spt5 [Thermoplasmatota archaeon]